MVDIPTAAYVVESVVKREPCGLDGVDRSWSQDHVGIDQNRTDAAHQPSTAALNF